MNDKIWTIKELLSWTTKYFEEKNIDAPRLSSELLLSKVLNQDRLYLYTNFSQPLKKDELKNFKEFIKRRVDGEPVAYITGEKEFWSLKFKVNKNVLIPRPETEILVEIFNELTDKDYEEIKILEIGTGSGNIAAAIVSENKNCKIFSVDISFDALKLARTNFNLNNVNENIFLINGDTLFPLKKTVKFDFIVSNPPYIKSSDIDNLQREIKYFEPLSALDGGKDGLDFFRKILSNAKKHLKEKGMIIFEFGEKSQGVEIKKIMLDFGYKDIVIKNDYSNNPRIIYCKNN